jgi:hypothetical protein
MPRIQYEQAVSRRHVVQLCNTEGTAKFESGQDHALQHTFIAVVVRIDSRFWADSTLMRRRMSSCMVMPWSVVYSVISLAILSAWVYISAMLSRPVLTSGSVQRPAPPGTCAYVLAADTAHAQPASHQPLCSPDGCVVLPVLTFSCARQTAQMPRGACDASIG